MGLRDWIPGLSGDQEQERPKELREFVYLDRDSVVSLLASIEGAIKQERVEQIGSSSENRVSGGVKAEISGVGANVGGERVTMEEDSTEIVHNYAIQSLFDELEKHRRSDDEIGVLPIEDGEKRDISDVSRKDVLRVEVELETHYLYRFYRVMKYIQENIPEAVGPEDEDVLELIESMFGNEVPVSGRVLDYQVEDDEIRPAEACGSDAEPLQIVGNLNIAKMWQDIPDILFDKEEFTMFCRVEQKHEDGEWHPLSIAQRIETVSPGLAQTITHFMERGADLTEREASKGQSGNVNLEGWVDDLAKFDKLANISVVDEDFHREFLIDYVDEEGTLAVSRSGNMELVEFYHKYADRLREKEITLSSTKEAEAINNMIFDDHHSMDDPGDRKAVEGVQIETKIIAIYW